MNKVNNNKRTFYLFVDYLVHFNLCSCNFLVGVVAVIVVVLLIIFLKKNNNIHYCFID